MTDERKRLFDSCPPPWRHWCAFPDCAEQGRCHGCILRWAGTMRAAAVQGGMPMPELPTAAEFAEWQAQRR